MCEKRTQKYSKTKKFPCMRFLMTGNTASRQKDTQMASRQRDIQTGRLHVLCVIYPDFKNIIYICTRI
jgi:hypothetical protein